MIGLLKGTGWRNAWSNPACDGMFLVVMEAARRHCLSTRTVHVPLIPGGRLERFTGALLSSPSYEESIDVLEGGMFSPSTFEFEVPMDHFDLQEITGSGYPMLESIVDVYWHVSGMGLALSNSVHVLHGQVADFVVDEERRTAKVTVEDRTLIDTRPFPLVRITDTVPGGVGTEQYGKPYPVVFGTVKQMPVIEASGGANMTFIVAADPAKIMGGSSVTMVYNGEDEVGFDDQEWDDDSEGNGYWRTLHLADVGSSNDVTADLTGYPGDFRSVLLSLFNDFSGLPGRINSSSLWRVNLRLSAINFGFYINDDAGNVMDFIRNRICGKYPIVMRQSGEWVDFRVLDWDRNPRKVLTFDRNILRKSSLPQETPIERVCNSFLVKYAMNGARGNSTGAIKRDHTNDYDCLMSKRRYGPRSYGDIDAGELSDSAGAEWMMRWAVQTHTRKRVEVGYKCNLDAANLSLCNTVRVIDKHEGWDALFKVRSLKYLEGTEINVGLVSVDDCFRVYNVGRR